jgi:hypothetical protein
VSSRARLGAGFVALALVAEWLGHAAVWFLTGGTAPARALSGPLHAYLGPLGLVIAVVAVASSWAVWQGLDRLVELTGRFRQATERRDATDGPIDWQPSPHRLPGAGRVGLSLALVQVVVYLCQENLEARVIGLTAPGLHVLTAHHGAPIAIHLALAFVATSVAVSVLDHWHERTDELDRAVVRYHALVGRPAVSAMAPTPRPDLRPPALRYGRSLLGRAPPFVAA